MAAFTPNSGGTVNWDTLSGGSTNATLDTYTISNGTTLLIDTDSYQCANHSAAFGSVDTVSFTGTGGKLKIDGTNVRVIPYNTGTGNVPAIGTTISQGGVSGTLLGVWDTWLVEPTASGAAMPADGYIKIKGKTGGNFSSGALTGIGASATGADVVGWIEVRGADTATITVPRIGAFEVVGDWFEIGTTNGSRGQVIPCPTCATVAGVFPGVWIETSAGSGVYERYAGAGSQVALSTTRTDASMKIVWQTTGGIRIGSDGTNNVGYLPATGCKVRVPNVILTCCTRSAGSGSGPRVLPNATLATRQEFVTTAAGDIQISNCVFQWYGNFLQAFKANVAHSAFNDTLILREIASPLSVNNVIVSPTQAQINVALNLVSCFGGGTIQESNFWRFSLASSGSYGAAINYVTGVTFTNVVIGSLTLRANATTGCITSTQAKNCTFSGLTLIGGQALMVGAQSCTFTNTSYYDHTITTTTSSTNPMYCFSFTTGGSGNMVDGILLPLSANGPYAGLVGLNACYNSTVRNIGSYGTPLAFNSSVTAYIVNGLGNNDGIRIQRCYTSGARTGVVTFLNSDNNVTMETVIGDVADAFTIAALNAVAKGVQATATTTGQTSVYGTHWRDVFITAGSVGKIEVLCNGPTTASAAQCAITAGSPKFDSAGQVALTVLNQQVTWEMPYFAKGHTSFQNAAPVLTGTNTGNLTYEFQYDLGSGYNGSWLTLNATNLNAVGAITPATGVRLKVRATCATANAGNLLTNISILTNTNSTDQNQTYPLEVAPISVTGLVTGSRVKFTKVSDGTLLYQAAESGGVVTFASNEYTGAVQIEARKASASPNYIPWITQVTPVSGSTTTATALQQTDE